LHRIVLGQTAPDELDGVVRFAEEQLPQSLTQHGFKGVYLLTDRETGDLVTISLWETWEDLQLVEARAAELHSKSEQSVDITAEPVKVYKVDIAQLT